MPRSRCRADRRLRRPIDLLGRGGVACEQRVAESNTVLVDHVLNSTITWLCYLQTGFAVEFDERYARPLSAFGMRRRAFFLALTSIATKSPGS
jgi:hypothetical protein